MNKIYIIALAVALLCQGCFLDRSCTGPGPDVGDDADVMYDAGEIHADADTDAGVDAHMDDAGIREDAGVMVDAGDVPRDSGMSATDAGHDAGSDSGPPGPRRGSPIALSDRYCALDDMQQLWCWNRFSTPDEVRLIAGSPADTDPIVELVGECFRRASGEVACAAFSPEGEVPVIDPATSSPAVVTALWPSPTLTYGCAITTSGMWCWHDGVMDLKYSGNPEAAWTTDRPGCCGRDGHVLNTPLTTARGMWLYYGGLISGLVDTGGPFVIAPDGRVCRQNPRVGLWDCRADGSSAFSTSSAPGTTTDGELSCYATTTAVRCGYYTPSSFPEHDVSTHPAGSIVDTHVMPGDRTVCTLASGSITCHSVWGTVSSGPTPTW